MTVDYSLGASRKLKKQLGRYYLLMMDVQSQRWFNGLPPADSKIVVLDDNVRKNAESGVDGYEMVYRVIDVPEYDIVLAEGQNNFVKVPPIANVGDVVLAKGNVFIIHSEPLLYAALRDNLVAVLDQEVK